MYDDFFGYIYGSMGLNSGSMSKYIYDVTKKLFELKKKPNYTEIAEVNINKVIPQKFFLIQYNYNGNKIWCPILALDYKVIKNKNILYALNLEYLPPLYKIKFFDKVFKRIIPYLEKTANVTELRSERPIKPLTFEIIYKSLKQYGEMNYAITAYDYLKISKAYSISIKILPEIIMCDPKAYNSASMKELFEKIPESDEKDTLENIIKTHDELVETYQEDSIKYHKQVAAFEKHLKIIK